MGYSVYVGDQNFNYTFNLGRFFRDFEIYIKDWSGKSGSEVGLEILEAFRLINEQARKDSGYFAMELKYNSKNGWGDVYGAIKFLMDIAISCVEEPDSIVEVYF